MSRALAMLQWAAGMVEGVCLQHGRAWGTLSPSLQSTPGACCVAMAAGMVEGVCVQHARAWEYSVTISASTPVRWGGMVDRGAAG